MTANLAVEPGQCSHQKYDHCRYYSGYLRPTSSSHIKIHPPAVHHQQFTTKLVQYLDEKHHRAKFYSTTGSWYYLAIHLVITILCPQRSAAQKKARAAVCAGAHKKRSAQAEGAGPLSSLWLGSKTGQKAAENTSCKYVCKKNGRLNTYLFWSGVSKPADRMYQMFKHLQCTCCLAVWAGAEEEEREPAERSRVCSRERNPETCSDFLLVMTSAKETWKHCSWTGSYSPTKIRITSEWQLSQTGIMKAELCLSVLHQNYLDGFFVTV